LQETVEVTVIPLAGSEEGTVATWLNKIVSSLPPPQTSNSSQSSPEGWKGIHLAPSGNSNNPLRLWSSQFAVKPVGNTQFSIKPDIVFCGQLDPHDGLAWRNVISFIELTSSAFSAQLRRNITRKAYAIFMSQPCRRFVIAISIAQQEFRIHLFDRSGVIHSLGHNIHKSSNLFARVLYVLAFGSPASLGFDPTFIDSSLSPSFLFRPRTTPAIKKSQLIYVGTIPYNVVRPIFASHLIRGRATSSWLVKRGKKRYVVKDYWTHKGRKVAEEEILKRIIGLLGVPQLVEAWTVQVNGTDETTDSLRPSFLVKNVEFETRIHRRILMTPVGDPLISFTSLQEFVSIFIDIVHGKHQVSIRMSTTHFRYWQFTAFSWMHTAFFTGTSVSTTSSSSPVQPLGPVPYRTMNRNEKLSSLRRSFDAVYSSTLIIPVC
jgi:Fungal protein kinase